MPNKIPPRINSGFNSIINPPFEKIKRPNPNINKINVICDGNPIKQMKSINDNQIHNSPFQFDVNLYFGNPKSSFTPIHQIDNYYYSHHNDTNPNMPVCLLFKASLSSSGFSLSKAVIAFVTLVLKSLASVKGEFLKS